jgi:thiol-disulfide isomerase/thioredoxin
VQSVVPYRTVEGFQSNFVLTLVPLYSFHKNRFVAPWCKSCQRLGQHFQKLAIELGDGIVDRQKVEGSIRFAQVEYSDETSLFLTEQLQIRQVPTLQLYRSKQKLYEEAGMTNTKGLQTAMQALPTDAYELLAHAEEVDDGILEAAIDEAFYESPSFLDEEW